jgi:hypothetical protein
VIRLARCSREIPLFSVRQKLDAEGDCPVFTRALIGTDTLAPTLCLEGFQRNHHVLCCDALSSNFGDGGDSVTKGRDMQPVFTKSEGCEDHRLDLRAAIAH